MNRLTKTKAPTPEEQVLYDRFCELCAEISHYTQMVPIGSKFGYGGKVVWITYKASQLNTKWIYVYPQERLLNSWHNMYFWSVTIESQNKILDILTDKLQEYELSPHWQQVKENSIKKQKELQEKLKKFRNNE